MNDFDEKTWVQKSSYTFYWFCNVTMSIKPKNPDMFQEREFPYNPMTRGWDWNPQSYEVTMSINLGFN